MKTGFKILISLGTGILCFGLSMFSQLLLLPFLALAGFMAAEWGAYYALPALLGVAAGVMLPSGTSAGSIVTIVMLLLVPVTLFVYSKKKLPHRYAALALAVILTLGMYLSMTADSILAGEAPYAEAVRVWNEAAESTLAMFGGASNSVELSAAFGAVAEYIPDALMPTSILMGGSLALLLVLLYRAITLLFKAGQRPMAAFSDWRLPHTALWGSLILLVVIPIAYLFRFNRAASIAISVVLIVVPLFSMQGLSVLLFMMKAGRAPVGLRILTVVIPIFLLPYSLILLGYFGVREQIKNRRRLVREYTEEMERMSEAEKRANEINKYGYSRGGSGESPDDKEKKEENEDNDHKEDE